MELSWEFLFDFFYVFFLFVDVCFYIVALILQYKTSFEIGMNLCMDKFIL